MWNELSPADIERAKHLLAKIRSEMLRRHEEELNRLDIDQHEIEVLARLVHAFAKKHLAPSVHEPHDFRRQSPAAVQSNKPRNAAA